MYMVEGENNKPGGQFRGRLERKLRQLNWRHAAFYFVVPLLLAVFSALEVHRFVDDVTFWRTFVFYAGHAFVPWWIACIVTHGVKVTLKALRPNQLIILLLGILIAILLSRPYGLWLQAHYLTVNANIGDFPVTGIGLREKSLWLYIVQTSLTWVGVNYVFDRFLAFPRYRYLEDPVNRQSRASVAEDRSPAAADRDVAKPLIVAPRFLDHIQGSANLDDIYAIKAEQHYIRIYTQEQDHMILYRFSDAVAEIDKDVGIQVHRSFWIRKDAMARIETDNKKMFVRLQHDLKVPVSQPYQALVKQAYDSLTSGS